MRQSSITLRSVVRGSRPVKCLYSQQIASQNNGYANFVAYIYGSYSQKLLMRNVTFFKPARWQSNSALHNYSKHTDGMFYCCFRVHNSWYRYTIRFSFTTCFDLMGPSSGMLCLTITCFFSCYSPYTLGVRCMCCPMLRKQQ
jgi:hypothetical protein